MAFFELGRKLQVILIASGLAVGAAPGCKPKAGETGTSTGGGPKVSCEAMDVSGTEVSVTRSGATRSTLVISILGEIPAGSKIEQTFTAEDVSVVRSEPQPDGSIELDVDHEGLEPGETGWLVFKVSVVCGKQEVVYGERIGICKQAGGLKILEGGEGFCEGPPPPPPPTADASTQPDVIIIGDPPPPPPDPVPPPADPPPPPPDPVPMPVDPAPAPNKDPAPMSFLEKAPVVERGPFAHSEVVSGPGIYHPRLEAVPEQDGAVVLHLLNRWGGDRTPDSVGWRCSGGRLVAVSGPSARWRPGDDDEVHAVMAVVRLEGRLFIETWKRVPGERDD